MSSVEVPGGGEMNCRGKIELGLTEEWWPDKRGFTWIGFEVMNTEFWR